MSADDFDKSSPSDPNYQGAKPAGIGGNPYGYEGSFLGAAPEARLEAMNAQLARNWWAIALRGVIGILFAIAAFVLPGVTLASLVLLFGAYMAADGILALVAALRSARQGERWGWLVFEGIADLVAAAIAFFMPLATVLAFVYLIAAWAIVSGAMLISAAFRLHPTHGKGFMILGGVVSLVWGVLLVLQPFIGAIVLTWWLGGYALVFGVALLVLAFRLRARSAPPAGGRLSPAS